MDAESQFAGLVSWSQDVRGAMRRLDPTQSRVLQMIYFERRTHDEVAAELRLPKPTVVRTLSAALQTFGLLMMTANSD